MFKTLTSCLLPTLLVGTLSLPLQAQDVGISSLEHDIVVPPTGSMFVYAPYHDSLILVAELQPTIGGRTDLARLCTIDGDVPIPIVISAASNSTDMDNLRFVYVPHKPSETALTRADDSIAIGTRVALDMSAVTPAGDDVTPLLTSPDGMSWSSSERTHFFDTTGTQLNLVEITTVAPGLSSLDLRVRWKQRPRTTATRDTGGLGMKIVVWDGVRWHPETALVDVHETVWREESVSISTCAQDTVRIQLHSPSGSIEIDAVEIGIPQTARAEEVAMTWSVLPTTEELEPRTTTELVLQPPAGARHGTVFVRLSTSP